MSEVHLLQIKVFLQGRRNLVIAANGSTKVFSKSGKQVKSFPSNLPGGNRNQNRRNTYTILDCIYSESNSIFYILDMMCWDGFQYYDCDTEFRLSWVQQKFIENQEMRTRSRINPYSFQPLPVYQCTRESIKEALNSPMPFSDHLDGLLIYHREVGNTTSSFICFLHECRYRSTTCLARPLW